MSRTKRPDSLRRKTALCSARPAQKQERVLRSEFKSIFLLFFYLIEYLVFCLAVSLYFRCTEVVFDLST